MSGPHYFDDEKTYANKWDSLKEYIERRLRNSKDNGSIVAYEIILEGMKEIEDTTKEKNCWTCLYMTDLKSETCRKCNENIITSGDICTSWVKGPNYEGE